MNEQEYIAHYGVLGMKWGRRKNKYGRYSEDSRNVSILTKKKISSLSNAELKEIATRAELEKKYDAYKTSKSLSSKIGATIGKTVAVAATAALQQAANKYVGQAFSSVLK